MSRVKQIAKAAADRVLIPPFKYFFDKVIVPPPHTIISEVHAKTIAECANYVIANMNRALQFSSKSLMWDYAIANKSVQGLIVEFGVADGASINYFARRVRPEQIFGFDSFEGLAEDWAGTGLAKGTFDRGGALPTVEPNVTLIKGWFDKTLPPFMSGKEQPLALVHIDCDTYESTKIIFGFIANSLVVGTIIIFDEYFGYRGWRINEYRAWQELVEAKRISYDYIAYSLNQVCIKITSLEAT